MGTFRSPYSQMQEHDGKQFEILRELTDDERDGEVGPMYRIRLEDGIVIDAWPEELTEL